MGRWVRLMGYLSSRGTQRWSFYGCVSSARASLQARNGNEQVRKRVVVLMKSYAFVSLHNSYLWIQLLVNKSFFIYYFFDLIVKRYDIDNIPIYTPVWRRFLGIRSSLRGSLSPLVVRGFSPSAIVSSNLRRLEFPRLSCLHRCKNRILRFYNFYKKRFLRFFLIFGTFFIF